MSWLIVCSSLRDKRMKKIFKSFLCALVWKYAYCCILFIINKHMHRLHLAASLLWMCGLSQQHVLQDYPQSLCTASQDRYTGPLNSKLYGIQQELNRNQNHHETIQSLQKRSQEEENIFIFTECNYCSAYGSLHVFTSWIIPSDLQQWQAVCLQ